jgi:hypothetical protein
LAGDLDCTGFTGGISDAAVTVGRSATLDLQGHTITGAIFGVACYLPCEDGNGACSNGNSCLVESGIVTGADASGITGDRVKVCNLTVTANGDNGVQGNHVSVLDSTLNGNGRFGASAYTIKVKRSTLNGNAWGGVGAGKYAGNGRWTHGVRASASTMTGNGIAAECGVRCAVARRLLHATESARHHVRHERGFPNEHQRSQTLRQQPQLVRLRRRLSHVPNTAKGPRVTRRRISWSRFAWRLVGESAQHGSRAETHLVPSEGRAPNPLIERCSEGETDAPLPTPPLWNLDEIE